MRNKHLLNRLFIPALLVVALLVPTLEAKSKSARAAAQPAASQQRQSAEIWQRTELYFGSAKPDGSAVTEAEFMQFIDTVVTPRFPDGLTLLTGYGQFRNSSGQIVRERSMQLILLYPILMRNANRKIEEIRDAYKQSFQQESVLRVDSLAAVSF